MGDRQDGREVNLLSRRVLLDVLLVIGELRTLAKTDVALRRAIAGDAFKGSGTIGIDGCDSGLTADSCHYVAVSVYACEDG